MDRHTCKLCFRRFHNGRALGGHMRSHVVAAAAAAAYSPPAPLQQQQSPPLSLASTSSTEMGDKATQRKLKKSFLEVGATEFSGGVVAGGESSVVQDGESDTESSPRGGAWFAVSRRRSKRARRRCAPPAAPDPEPASSVSDATPEEDVAMSLVMLSRDSWTRSRSGPEHRWAPASSGAGQRNGSVNLFDADEAEHGVAGEDFEEEYGEATARPRGRHQCGACKKVFRSYQALGGHRASVKKGKGGCVPAAPAPVRPPTPSKAPVIHECPFCLRVFESGQALGGHKRAHMPYAPSPSPAKCGDSSGSIDLNVPAAMDDDFELSAVYDDSEFVSARQ
ncbi:hypothetical protein ACP70R_020897 [Stipagrostis hirtigluma subsp. patula]